MDSEMTPATDRCIDDPGIIWLLSEPGRWSKDDLRIIISITKLAK